jgi:hypothetical protein
MPNLHASPDAAKLLAELAPKYVWWRRANGGTHKPERIVAQVMNLGTYDDIRRLERVFTPPELAEVMRHAQPGWFTPRSWEFWRGRLSAGGISIAASPPRRMFHAAIA